MVDGHSDVSDGRRRTVSLGEASFDGARVTASSRGQEDAMSTDDNRRIITEMFSRWSGGDASGFYEMMADDISVTAIGTTKYSGTVVGKEEVAAYFGPFLTLLAELALTAETIIADGDLVAVQSRGRSRTKDGRDYNNVYAQFFRMSNGKIVQYTEYFDTELTNSVFGK
jgi:ketosteroid isomerase-like protein